MRARVKAKRTRRAEVVAVQAVPHEWVDQQDVRISVAYVANWVSAGGGPELQIAGVRANEEVTVIRAATSVVDAERVVYRNGSA